jgi:hypothetical protein
LDLRDFNFSFPRLSRNGKHQRRRKTISVAGMQILPNVVINLKVIIKYSIQFKVWLGLGLSILFVISILKLTQHALNHLPANWEYKSRSNKGSRQLRNRNILLVAKKKSENEYLYVFGNLLSQGSIEAICYDSKD